MVENQTFIYLRDLKLETSRKLLTEQLIHLSDFRFHSVTNTTANNKYINNFIKYK